MTQVNAAQPPAWLPSDLRRMPTGALQVLIRSRPATPSQSRRYYAILDATVRRVREVGIDSTKIQDIANDSGVALATIYRYFDSRDYVIHVALSRWLADVENSAIVAWKEGQRLEDHMIAVIRGAAAALIKEPLLLQAWARSTLSPDPLVARLMRENRLEELSEIYPSRMKDPELRHDLSAQMGHAWFSGSVRWALGQKDWEDVPRDVERAMTVVLKAHRGSIDLRTPTAARRRSITAGANSESHS